MYQRIAFHRRHVHYNSYKFIDKYFLYFVRPCLLGEQCEPCLLRIHTTDIYIYIYIYIYIGEKEREREREREREKERN